MEPVKQDLNARFRARQVVAEMVRTARVLLLSILILAVSLVSILGQDNTAGLEIGDKHTAKAKIEIFYDLQCGSCTFYHETIKEIEKKYKGMISVTFRHFPLSIPAHDKAIMAARMVEAAKVQNRGLQMLDMVLADQRNWSTSKVAKSIFFGYAKKLKLNQRKFRRDFEDEGIIHRIVADIVRARELKLNSTPTVFLNGEQLSFADAGEIERKIQELVK